jgi:DNA-directed RNA polymerase specialized sigma24 family protein
VVCWCGVVSATGTPADDSRRSRTGASSIWPAPCWTAGTTATVYQQNTADLIQAAALKVWRVISDEAVRAEEPAQFYALLARVVRTSLIKLAEWCRNNGGAGAGTADDAGEAFPAATASDTWDPARLALWTEFHRQVERLADEERQVVDLVFYQGLGTDEAAAETACPAARSRSATRAPASGLARSVSKGRLLTALAHAWGCEQKRPPRIFSRTRGVTSPCRP